MSAIAYAEAVKQYADFAAQMRGMRLSHDELDQVSRAACSAYESAEARDGKPKIDGLEAVEWIKKYRNDNGTTLVLAKAEWDKRMQQRRGKTLIGQKS